MEVTNIDNQQVTGENILNKNLPLLEEHEMICPVSDVVAKFGDRWALFTMLTLGEHGRLRFNEIKHRIRDISQRMLTVTLRGLEENGLVTRTIYPEIPPRVEYELTGLGQELVIKIVDLSDWARLNMDEILVARKKFAKDYSIKEH
jgi:DNA-binding HxlR family transcriptional regulator